MYFDERVFIDAQMQERVASPHLDEEIWKRAVQPDQYTSSEEPYVYSTHESVQTLENGRIYQSFRIVRKPNRFPERPAAPQEPEEVLEEALRSRLDPLARAGAPSFVQIHIKLQGLPRFRVPARADSPALSLQQKAALERQRQEAFEARRELFQTAAEPLKAEILAQRGTIDIEHETTGWLTVTLPLDAVEILARRSDVRRILLAREVRENGCDPNCGWNDYNPSAWFLPPVVPGNPFWILGRGRNAAFLDIDRFHALGIDGSIPNPARHSHGFLLAAVVERHELWDEGCYLMAGPGCTDSRVIFKSSCTKERWVWLPYPHWETYCGEVSDFGFGGAEKCASDFHAIVVTSVLGADFTNGQGILHALNDFCWTSSNPEEDHCANFNANATGMAPKTRLAFFGNNPNDGNLAWSYRKAAYDPQYSLYADVLNLTNTTVARQCDPYSSEPDSDDMENAFDSGALVVIAAGNNGDEGVCNMDHPADTPKAFTVNSIDTSKEQSTCRDDYSVCKVRYPSSARGGARYPNASGTNRDVTLVDLIAPTRMSYSSNCRIRPWGETEYAYSDSFTFVNPFAENENGSAVGQDSAGSSFAAPHVAGAAIVMKEKMLADGVVNVNAPGALHTIMLAMGDRYASTTGGYRDVGGDPWSGFGRLKLRMISPFNPSFPVATGYAMHRYVFTNGSGSQSFMAFPKPVPNGANFLKCVSFNAEDVSEVPVMSHIQLNVQARAKTCIMGTIYNCFEWACTQGAFTGQGTKVDDYRDWKHMIAYEGTELAAFRNQCVGVTLNPIQVPAGKSVTTSVFCYFSNRTDREVY